MIYSSDHLERELRVIPMGRNYLFCWTELSAAQLGMLLSLMVACHIQGINLYTYLLHFGLENSMANDVE